MMMKTYIKKLTGEYERYCNVLKKHPLAYMPENPEDIRVEISCNKTNSKPGRIVLFINENGEEIFSLL